MTMMSRTPRQIVAFAVDNGVKAERIQEMADRVGYAREYCTDGCAVYREVIFGGKHKQNLENKSDTHNIESSNADLRHYIAGLRRKSRCFFRSQETLEAVLSVFIDAYNKFGEAKEKYKIPVEHRTTNTKHLHKYRERPFSVLDFYKIKHLRELLRKKPPAFYGFPPLSAALIKRPSDSALFRPVLCRKKISAERNPN